MITIAFNIEQDQENKGCMIWQSGNLPFFLFV